MSEAFLRAILAADQAAGETVTRSALRAGLSRQEVFRHVMAPAMHDVGELWAQGEISILDEHAATAITSLLIGRLPASTSGRSGAGRSAIVACPAPETHSLGALMFAETLRENGWNVVYAGSAVPTADLVAFAELRRPDLVGLSVGLSAHIPALREVVSALRCLPHPPVILAGGNASATLLAAGAGADCVSHETADLAEFAESVVGRRNSVTESLVNRACGDGPRPVVWRGRRVVPLITLPSTTARPKPVP